MIKVIVAEENYIFRKGLMKVLSEIDNVKVVSEVHNADSLYDHICKANADILFLSICIPGMDAVETAKRVLEIKPGLRIVALSLNCQNDYVHDLLQAGIYGYILKNVDKTDVERAISSIMENRYYFSTEVMSVLADNVINKTSTQEPIFTDKEMKMLELICKGYSTNCISRELSLSPRTCEGYRAKMISKANVENTIGLVVYAIRNGYVKV